MAAEPLTRPLAAPAPALSDTEVVFCTFPDPDIARLLSLAPLGYFAEAEGCSPIVITTVAERARIAFAGSYRGITLTVYSSLDAVGLTAAVAGRLARHGISANVVADFHHDHVFVPSDDADRALQAEAVAALRNGEP